MRVPLGARLKYTAGRYLPFLKIRPPAARDVVNHYRPVRNTVIEWARNDDGETLLTVPRRDDHVGRVVGFWFRLPQHRKVQLDEVGSFVWELCDGSLTVEGIVQRTSRHYKMNRREVEISVTQYLQMLAERNFIGFYQKAGRPASKTAGGKAT